MPEIVGAAPLLLALLMGNNNNNSAAQVANPIAGTTVVQEQVAELVEMCGRSKGSTEVGVLRLKGEDDHPPTLTQAQCESYNKDGYLVLQTAITADEASNLLNETHLMMTRIREGGEGVIRHDLSSYGAQTLSPAGRLLATFEPGDTEASNPFERRIARLGCGVHKIPKFHDLTHSTFHRSIAKSLGYIDARITQSQLIAKLAGIGGEIVPHQDGCVSFTNPPSALTFWYALEDTTLDNGCLYVAPGTHLTTPLKERLVMGGNRLPKFEDLPTPLWARGALRSEVDLERSSYEYEALKVKKGTLVLLHGNLMHKSAANKSGKDRVAYTFSIIEGSLECPDDSCMRPTEGDFESL